MFVAEATLGPGFGFGVVRPDAARQDARAGDFLTLMIEEGAGETIPNLDVTPSGEPSARDVADTVPPIWRAVPETPRTDKDAIPNECGAWAAPAELRAALPQVSDLSRDDRALPQSAAVKEDTSSRQEPTPASGTPALPTRSPAEGASGDGRFPATAKPSDESEDSPAPSPVRDRSGEVSSTRRPDGNGNSHRSEVSPGKEDSGRGAESADDGIEQPVDAFLQVVAETDVRAPARSGTSPLVPVEPEGANRPAVSLREISQPAEPAHVREAVPDPGLADDGRTARSAWPVEGAGERSGVWSDVKNSAREAAQDRTAKSHPKEAALVDVLNDRRDATSPAARPETRVHGPVPYSGPVRAHVHPGMFPQVLPMTTPDPDAGPGSPPDTAGGATGSERAGSVTPSAAPAPTQPRESVPPDFRVSHLSWGDSHFDMAPSTEGEEKLASLAHPDIARAATATEATQTGPAPATAPEAARSVAFQLATSVQAVRDGGVEINLSPEELGKVTLALHVSEGAVVLAIQAERPDTLDLIRRHIDVLERELRDAGYDSLSFSFGQGTADGRAAGNSAYSAVLEDRAATGIPAPDTNPRPAAQSSHNRLDLRL